ncbi:hypothetical protein MBRA1_001403 [Malassezia brasiliensis]|uniref:COP9 signalosome complex subunit 3 N-terminal helical repeats domain-containing protein n=1 Tax=Malassezia brasiliensis TaxID=1821822 RepID=A0AAF0IN65_9BASI|nr:hypothetical protein MBRA1_001403 [Malassezia brasiliensis]
MTSACSTAQLLDAAAQATREPARAAELLAPFCAQDVPDDVLLGDRAAPPWTRVEAPLAKLLCLAAELRAARSADEVLALEPGNTALTQAFPHAPLHAWAEALSDKGRLVSATYATPFLERATQAAPGMSGAHTALLYQYLVGGLWDEAAALVARTDWGARDLTGLPYVAVLAFLYYAGLVHARRDDLPAAINAWEMCMALPTEALSHIQLDAFRKLILVRLLCGDAVDTEALLRGLSASLRPQYMRQAQPYLALARSYGRRAEAEQVRTLVAAHRDQFIADANLGLVERCVALQPQRWLEALARAYACVPLEAVAAYLGCTQEEARACAAQASRVDADEVRAPLEAGRVPLPDGVVCDVAAASDAPYIRLAARAPPHAPLPCAAERTARPALAARLAHASRAPDHLAKLWSLHTSAAEHRP